VEKFAPNPPRGFFLPRFDAGRTPQAKYIFRKREKAPFRIGRKVQVDFSRSLFFSEVVSNMPGPSLFLCFPVLAVPVVSHLTTLESPCLFWPSSFFFSSPVPTLVYCPSLIVAFRVVLFPPCLTLPRTSPSGTLVVLVCYPMFARFRAFCW